MHKMKTMLKNIDVRQSAVTQKESSQQSSSLASEVAPPVIQPHSGGGSEIINWQQWIGNQNMLHALDADQLKKGFTLEQPLSAEIERARIEGETLPKSVRDEMESWLGTDLNQVRIHTTEKANTISHSIGAKAFTTGSDIFFKQGAYNPFSTEGKKLLMHELTHVNHQSSATPIPGSDMKVGDANTSEEQVANQSAENLQAPQAARQPVHSIQRFSLSDITSIFSGGGEGGGFSMPAPLQQAGETIGSAAGSWFGGIGGAANQLLSGGRQAGGTIAGGLSSGLNSLLGGASQGGSSFFSGLMGAGSSLMEGVQSGGVSGLLGGLSGAGSNLLQGVTGGASSLMSGIGGGISNVMSGLMGGGSQALEAGQGAWNQYRTGTRNAIGTLLAPVQQAFPNIGEMAQTGLGGAGQAVSGGLNQAQGLAQGTAGSVGGVASQAMNWLSGLF